MDRRRLLDSPWPYFALAGLLALAAVLSQFRLHLPSRPEGRIEQLAELRTRKPNVVFILVDTLRADRLSAYGYARPTSPVMKDLASYGVRFARVESQSSWTKSSMASLWTAMLPTHCGITRFEHALPPEATLPAELFQQAGYATAGVWRNGWVGQNFGFQQGFDTYLKPAPERVPEKFEKKTPGTNPLAGTDEDVTRAALGFLDVNREKPFLLYVHYMDVHQYAYDAEAAELRFGTSNSDAYDSAIHWVDRNVAAIVTFLEQHDLFKNTIVVIASDHGEAFREHGTEGHARNLYHEVTAVPLIVALPFRLEHGLVVEPLVRNLDIWPTLLDLAGLPPLPDADGRSLVPLIEASARGETDGPAPPAYAYLDVHWGHNKRAPHPITSAREGDRRLILGTRADRGGVEAFDLTSDPTEQKNLAGSPPDWVAKLRPGLEQSRDLKPVWGKVPEVELDEVSREILRALGYVVK